MDNLTKEQRSYNMHQIRSKNTKPEMLIRRYLFAKGLRYRLYDKNLPGKPDLVFKKYRTVVFVHGCFWHGHEGCRYAVMPKSNTDYWSRKIARNKQRDQDVLEQFEKLGWNVVIVWECELKGENRQRTLERIYYEVVFEAGPNNFSMDTAVGKEGLFKQMEGLEEQ